MRLVLGLAVLLCLASPQAAVAQAPPTNLLSGSRSQTMSRLEASSTTDAAPGVGETALLPNLPDFRGNPGRDALLEATEGNDAPVAVASSDRSTSNKAESKLAFRQGMQPEKPPIQVWRTLLFVQHGAAVFDAWSTRDAIQNDGAHELNPLFRPFAGSNAIYAATQVGPSLLDYLGHRMMTSKKSWMRKWWWVPQVAGTIGSLFSGTHNLIIAQGGPPRLAP